MDVVIPHLILEQHLDKGYTDNIGLPGFYASKIVDGYENPKAVNNLEMSSYDFDNFD